MSKKIKHEEAYHDYLKGMKYSDIATKYDVTLNTVKSWKNRHKWMRETEGECTQKKVCNKKGVQKKKSVQTKKPKISDEHERIRKNLLTQLEVKGAYKETYIDLVNDYMSMWEIKNKLIEDINSRGVQVKTYNSNGQMIYKKNDSIVELPKYNSQMLKLLNDLGLSAHEVDKGDGNDDL